MSGARTRTAPQVRTDAVLEFAHALVTAAQNRQLHGRDDANVVHGLVSMVLALRAASTAGVDMPLQLQFADDAIYHDGQPLVSPSLQARPLLAALAAREVAAMAFAPELDVEEGNRLFDLLLVEQNRDALLRQHRDQALRAFGIRHIHVTSRRPGDPSDRYAQLEHGQPSDLHHYQELAAALQQNTVEAARDRALGVSATATAIERTLMRLDQEPSGLLSLAAQDNVDRFTVGHSVRVALLALQVARAAGADRERLVEVGTAALLHDIGKSKVPQEILFKQGKLDEGEWVWMAQHPRLGADILLEQPDLMPSAVGAAFCHHLRPDGGGYPRALVPLQPSGTSRLVRVCDVFEALTSVRPYKRALTPLEAYAVMRRHEGDFDQRWFRLFVRTLGIFPQGSRVRLDDGSMAVVVRQGRTPAEPVVRLLTGPASTVLPAGAPDEIAIGQKVDGQVRRIYTVYTHDRSVPVPPEGFEALEFLTQTAHGACLRHD
ncbi:MAG: HD-GYP domain-containing protein [Planctomycetota bacterium]